MSQILPLKTTRAVFLSSWIIICLTTCHVSSAGALQFFREVNNEIAEGLKNDRPCNFLLDLEDAHLNTIGIIKKYGYPAERHWVTTNDGYILEIHRIPPLGGANGSTKPAPAVFLMHGVMSSSRDFVVNCDRRALAFQLSDNGYDVWMGNARGNVYGRNHTKLSPKHSKFWDFSIDEVGFYDVPAIVDHILEVTTLEKISFVAHSMGNGVGLIMLSVRPEYNDKINFFFALSAAPTLKETRSTVLKFMASFPRTWGFMLRKFNRGRFFPPLLLKLFHLKFPFLCRREGRTRDYHGICSMITYSFDGYDPGQISPEMWSVITGESPTTTSVKFLCQWMQWIISGDFAMYDEGPLKNLRKYGSVKPISFPFKNMRVPSILFWGENDWVVSKESVQTTITMVENDWPDAPSIEFYKVPSPHWNHMDFIFGKDADVLVYKHILERLELLYPNTRTNASNQLAR